MIGKATVLIGLMALVVLLAACAEGYEPAPATTAPQGTIAPYGHSVPVEGALVTDLPEGFNTIGGSATVNDAAYDLTFFQHYGVNPFIEAPVTA
ncbi:MAG: hypothetical protein J4F43_12035 [Dehalococcoidia bacterium]|nr:hypothetical protein [Dehalococcoidia bacterium]